ILLMSKHVSTAISATHSHHLYAWTEHDSPNASTRRLSKELNAPRNIVNRITEVAMA
ncbi:hypothetical protein L9F63_016206, partial [Diploptera punctata]